MIFKPIAVLLLLLPYPLLSQTDGVGIGTAYPRTLLEVAGDTKITNTIEIGVIENLEDGDESTFLIQESNQDIKTLDVSNPTGAALGYIQEYELYDPQEDWVYEFDTQISSTDFVVTAISAHYDRELDIPSYATIPYYSCYEKDGTWRITADFPVANNRYSSEIGTWTVTTLIYSRDLSKQLGTITIPMGGNSTASASTPIID